MALARMRIWWVLIVAQYWIALDRLSNAVGSRCTFRPVDVSISATDLLLKKNNPVSVHPPITDTSLRNWTIIAGASEINENQKRNKLRLRRSKKKSAIRERWRRKTNKIWSKFASFKVERDYERSGQGMESRLERLESKFVKQFLIFKNFKNISNSSTFVLWNSLKSNVLSQKSLSGCS